MKIRIASLAVFAAIAMAVTVPSTASAQSGSRADSQAGDQSGAMPGSVADFAASMPNTVYFDFNRANLTPEARGTLDAQGEWLLTHSDVTVDLAGHTDAVGNAQYNDALGLRRADAVRDYLIALGIAPGRMTSVVSYGEQQLAVPTEQRERLNRRVTTVVTGRVSPGPIASCPPPEASELAQMSDLRALRDELQMRIDQAIEVENGIRASYSQGGGRPLFTEANVTKVECSVSLGYARSGDLHPRHVALCDCHHQAMVALLQ